MKKILGLDLGTNSVGWALVNHNFENKQGEIIGIGSRIIPTDPEMMGRFSEGKALTKANAGQAYTPTGKRTDYRGIRRLRERHLLRRERIHRVLKVLGFLPEHYQLEIDFEKRLGKFFEDKEPKLAFNNKEFIFKNSFNEMLEDFKKYQPQLLINKKGEPAIVPYDWTIYYLRKKALRKKIEKEELAWIILNFNQKRGYYQLRGEEEEENPNKLVEFYSLKVVDVEADEKPNSKGETWYSLKLENGWIYRRSSKVPLDDWKDKIKDFIVTTDLNEDGSIKTDKEGEEKRSFRAPKEDDWSLVKKKTEQEIDTSTKTVGEYIYDALLNNPNQKIKGKLVRTIERKFYRKELEEILKKQIDLQPELFVDEKYNECVRELYKSNEAHQLTLSKKDFVHLFVNDIIFYQRPLRSQKSSISNCSLEYRKFSVDGEERKEYLKAIPKSNPYYQEFRVWQWLYNLKIYEKNDDRDVTNQFIKSIDDFENLFEFLMVRKEVNHKDIFKYFFADLKGKAQNEKIAQYRWNYVYDAEKDESKSYPMNETGYEINRRLLKVENLPKNFLTREIEQNLWHIIYSVTDKIDYEKALNKFASKNNIHVESFVEQFVKFKPFASEYGAYSEKAIKKLLPLMRVGKFWKFGKIDTKTQNRISQIINAEDSNIKLIVREKAEKYQLNTESDFQGLPLWLAQYVVYDRHSEADGLNKWQSVGELEVFLKEFKQHSLRNPIVEQVITETLRVVKDIWLKYGNGEKDFFDEIHIELGREMKNTSEERKRLTSIVTENENTNLRIKALLIELKNDSNVENVRPYSPMQQEILKIYEDGVINSTIEIEEDILKISKKAEPSKSELQRYKLWLEQKYRSPYTGEVIPLNKLFTTDYEIEHIIPQSRYFDDSLSNKVICESAVNKLKDNTLGLEFIKNHFGEKIEVGFGKVVKIFTEEAYRNFVEQHYAKNRSKKTKLLLEEIPEKMIERQMNDTRYISKFISQLLSNIVRVEDGSDVGVNSKNVISVNGKITTQLKQDWGLNDVWNDLILPRFERMNQLTQSNLFTTYNEKYQKLLPAVPYEYSKGFQKKRIDHRHHALDALIIALATRDHVNLLNNQSAKSETKRYDLQRKLRKMVFVEYIDSQTGKQVKREVPKDFLKPWDSITQDTRKVIENVVVSFKQNMRIINKATNRYIKYETQNGELKKAVVEQKGTNWAVRKSLHKDTVSGQVNLPRIKVPKDKILTATRKSIDPSFNLKTIESITDTGIQKILKNYLKSKGGDSELAFSPEGLEDLNKNISIYNDGKYHKPIYKARVFEVGSKFALGTKGNKKAKFVEAAKGTNLFFAVYADESGKRNYSTIPLNEVIERQKQGLSPAPDFNEKGHPLLFTLSPNDLVYVPLPDESIDEINFNNLRREQVERVYKMEKSSGVECYFIRNDIASLVKQYDAKSKLGELESQNKLQTTMTEDRVKVVESCIKLIVDRLGNISKA